MSTGATVTELHKRHHDDYDEAKGQIYQSLGSIKDLWITGRQVLVACYVRPAFSTLPNGGKVYTTAKVQAEDVYQGKGLLILKLGPSAFDGDEGYVKATFGDRGPPKVGDWVFARPQDGISTNLCGDGASRPKGKQYNDTEIDLYEWDGWPCRIINDEAIIGGMDKPHVVV